MGLEIYFVNVFVVMKIFSIYFFVYIGSFIYLCIGFFVINRKWNIVSNKG